MKMKKIIILSFAAVIAVAGCKKQHTTISNVVTASYPKVTITSSPYVSIPVGGTFVPPTATAYDSFYRQSLSVVKDLGALDNTTPGLYVIAYTAKSQYGFTGSAYVYVAVTNVSDTMDLTGLYYRNGVNPAYITKLARGLYETSNVGGDDSITQASSVIPAFFAVTTDSTLDFGTQTTSAGTLTASQGKVSYSPPHGDTTISYAISLSGFGTQVRSFVR